MTLPRKEQIIDLHRKYAQNEHLFDLVFTHCVIVADIAMWCANNITQQKINRELLKTASLLHDIGAYAFLDKKGKSMDDKKYPQHALFGAKILADEGIDKNVVEIVESHVLLGLTKQEIRKGSWQLPYRDYEPTSIEGRLLCYADRFHSKHPVFNSFNSFIKRLEKDLPLQAKKFEAWSKEFEIPDIGKFAEKYKHPVR